MAGECLPCVSVRISVSGLDNNKSGKISLLSSYPENVSHFTCQSNQRQRALQSGGHKEDPTANTAFDLHEYDVDKDNIADDGGNDIEIGKASMKYFVAKFNTLLNPTGDVGVFGCCLFGTLVEVCDYLWRFQEIFIVIEEETTSNNENISSTPQGNNTSTEYCFFSLSDIISPDESSLYFTEGFFEAHEVLDRSEGNGKLTVSLRLDAFEYLVGQDDQLSDVTKCCRCSVVSERENRLFPGNALRFLSHSPILCKPSLKQPFYLSLRPADKGGESSGENESMLRPNYNDRNSIKRQKDNCKNHVPINRIKIRYGTVEQELCILPALPLVPYNSDSPLPTQRSLSCRTTRQTQSESWFPPCRFTMVLVETWKEASSYLSKFELWGSSKSQRPTSLEENSAPQEFPIDTKPLSLKLSQMAASLDDTLGIGGVENGSIMSSRQGIRTGFGSSGSTIIKAKVYPLFNELTPRSLVSSSGEGGGIGHRADANVAADNCLPFKEFASEQKNVTSANRAVDEMLQLRNVSSSVRISLNEESGGRVSFVGMDEEDSFRHHPKNENLLINSATRKDCMITSFEASVSTREIVAKNVNNLKSRRSIFWNRQQKLSDNPSKLTTVPQYEDNNPHIVSFKPLLSSIQPPDLSSPHSPISKHQKSFRSFAKNSEVTNDWISPDIEYVENNFGERRKTPNGQNIRDNIQYTAPAKLDEKPESLNVFKKANSQTERMRDTDAFLDGSTFQERFSDDKVKLFANEYCKRETIRAKEFTERTTELRRLEAELTAKLKIMSERENQIVAATHQIKCERESLKVAAEQAKEELRLAHQRMRQQYDISLQAERRRYNLLEEENNKLREEENKRLREEENKRLREEENKRLREEENKRLREEENKRLREEENKRLREEENKRVREEVEELKKVNSNRTTESIHNSLNNRFISPNTTQRPNATQWDNIGNVFSTSLGPKRYPIHAAWSWRK